LLDKIDADRKELTRKEEGLRLALEELEPKINAAQQEITAARRVQDEQEQEQRFRVLALHAQACQALAEVRLAQKDLCERFGHRGQAAAERIVQQPLWNLPHQLQTVKKWTHPRANINMHRLGCILVNTHANRSAFLLGWFSFVVHIGSIQRMAQVAPYFPPTSE